MSTAAKPGQSGIIYPAILPAADLQSAIAAANAAGRILATLYSPGPAVNNLFPQRPFGYTKQAGYNGMSVATGVGPMRTLWTEDMSKRVYNVKRFYGAQNDVPTKDIWIDVERIMHMEIYNTVSGDVIVWEFGNG